MSSSTLQLKQMQLEQVQLEEPQLEKTSSELYEPDYDCIETTTEATSSKAQEIVRDAFERHYDGLKRYLIARWPWLGEHDDLRADDIIQNMFVEILRRPDMLEGYLSSSKPLGFLVRTVVNKYHHHTREHADEDKNYLLGNKIGENLAGFDVITYDHSYVVRRQGKDTDKEFITFEDLEQFLELLVDDIPENEFNIFRKIVDLCPTGIRVERTLLWEDLQRAQRVTAVLRNFIDSPFVIGDELRPFPRKLVTAECPPLRLVWENSNFNRDPLQYYRDHPECYQDLSSSELLQFDPNLHNALFKSGTLKDAISVRKRTVITEEVETTIVDAYEPSGRRAPQARRLLEKSGIKVSIPTVEKYWIKNDLIPQTSKYSTSEQETIRLAHKESKGLLSPALTFLQAKGIQISRSGLEKIWNKEGLYKTERA